MTALVDLNYAKEQLRIDGEADDAWLQLAIDGASHAVRQWCTAGVEDVDGTVLPNVVLAVLVEVAYQSANREGPAVAYLQDWFAAGYPLSAGCVALLQSQHVPVLV